MIVSWNWLKDYLDLDMPVERFAERLMMAGLNHESTSQAGDDWAIDLEVTSNRPDCLGHIGIAREAAVLFELPLKIPDPNPPQEEVFASELATVRNAAPDLCARYTARIIRGVKIGPSPDWLARRLRAVGVAVINNVVDATNYMLLECGQPLHAFDYAQLRGQEIVVRPALPGEEFWAIDHRRYPLPEKCCVIADAERAVALGGVMGGVEAEVGDRTRDILLESAEFSPLSVRATARQLHLHSPSSYRFERGVDPEGVDWASRRCCELILQTAGGELARGVIDVGRQPTSRAPVVLRLSQLKRVLGIDIEPRTVRKILSALGNRETQADAQTVTVVPPSWRRDLTREIDLVEEVARIHGYDKIPEDVGVAMVASARSPQDRVVEQVRRVLVTCGFDEAMTTSAVEPPWSDAFSPWTDSPALQTATPVLRRADCLRRSLVPSLLGTRRTNESLANGRVDLFEIASVYLPQASGLPREERMLGLASGEDFLTLKGVVEAILAQVNPGAALRVEVFNDRLVVPGRAARLFVGDHWIGVLGEVSPWGLKQFELRTPATIAEMKLAELFALAVPVRLHRPQSPFPSVVRDLNIVLDEPVRWSQIEEIVRAAAGELLEDLQIVENAPVSGNAELQGRYIFRDSQKIGVNKKSLVFRMTLRSASETLTHEAVDAVSGRIVERIATDLHGALRT